MSWWWAGAIGATKKALDSAEPKYQSFALVVGSATLVGASLLEILPSPDTPGGPWKVFAVSAHPRPAWCSPVAESPSVEHIQCDLGNRSEVVEKLSLLGSVTHVFYEGCDEESGDGDMNPAVLRNVLSAVVESSPNLQHVCLLTGRNHYIGFTGKTRVHEPPFSEDLPRLETPNVYYEMEDVLFDEISKKNGLIGWTVHRPSTIFGFSPKSKTNVIGSLCVYAAICRKTGTKLRFPGSKTAWEGFSDSSDSDLVAEHQIWAAVDPFAKNESFNCSNGDLFRWKLLWPMLAEHFGLESVGFEGDESRFKIQETMDGKDELWDEIVEEFQLTETKLSEIGNWEFVDSVLGFEYEHLDLMNKSKEHGFLGFRNTVSSFNGWIEKMKAYKIVP